MLSPHLALALAGGGCRDCATSGGPGTTFLQVGASVLAVLLLTGVAGELRGLRDHGPRNLGQPRHSASYLAVLSVSLWVIVAGELIALYGLFTAPAESWTQWAVAGALLLAVPSVPALALVSRWGERHVALRRGTLVGLAILVLSLVGLMAALTVKTVSNPPSGSGFHVFGTCASGDCGLKERARPTSRSAEVGKLNDGDSVAIVCQAIGEKLLDPSLGSSIVWDRLTDGHYVTDLYVDTPPVGDEIPSCPRPSGRRGAGEMSAHR